jgi:peptide/nickel transport system substrate-binding protein
MRVILALLLTCVFPAMAQRADLVIGRGNEHVALDPQFSRTGNNQMTAAHMFERLVGADRDMRPMPGLAASWRNLDSLTWEVVLRAGARWHDGAPVTAEDIAFALQRPPTLEGSPASFAASVQNIAAIEVVAPDRLIIRSREPDPLFVQEIGRVWMVQRRAVEAALVSGERARIAVGSGPYRFVAWQPGQRLLLERAPTWDGPAPDFARVELRFIANAATRVAALRAGDVDLIDIVPASVLPDLRNDARLRMAEAESLRLVYLALDSGRDESPYVTDAAGARLARNPLRDVRVRQAITLMVDREALVSRVLQGSGTPAGQLVPPGVFGHVPEFRAPPAAPAAARQRLADAGYPQGFGLAIHGSNDRFLQDAAVAQALGQMLARGGLRITEVRTLPYAVFARGATQREYSAFVFSYGSTTGEASAGLDALMHTPDPARGLGANNRVHYSNPGFDAVLGRALAEFDMPRREQLLGQATAIAMIDTALVPLYWQKVSWVSRAGIAYRPRRDEWTVAMDALRER